MASTLQKVSPCHEVANAEHLFLLVDDHPLYADGFSSAISRLYPHASIRHVANGKAAQAQMQREAFDLVFLDVHLPDTNGLYLLGELVQKKIWQPVAILTGRPEAAIVEHARQWGAVGVISKRSDLAHLRHVCDKILQGGKHYETELLEPHAPSLHTVNALTFRELEVLQVLAKGSENRDICHVLDISESTLKTHLKSLFQKFQVTNRTACVIKGLKEGLLLEFDTLPQD